MVEQAGASRAVVTPIAYPCADSCSAPADPAPFKKARFARLVEPGADLGIILSEPIRLDPADGFDYAPAIDALRSAIDSEALKARVSTRLTGYDIAVGLVDGKLAFAATGGAIDQHGPGSSARLTLSSNPKAATAEVSASFDPHRQGACAATAGQWRGGLRRA